MAEILTLAKGESITWILVVALIIGIYFLAKFFRDIFKDMMQRTEDLQEQLEKQSDDKEKFYKKQLDIQKHESEVTIAEVRKELHEERSNSEKERKKFIEGLETININTARTATILEKLETNVNHKFDSLYDEIKNIKENIN